MARPPSAVYRIQKAVRRHRLAYAAGGTVALTLVAGIAASSWQAVRATRAERSAREQAENARAVKDFIVEQFREANIMFGREADPRNRLMFDQAIRRLEGKFAKQPLVEADIRFALGFGWPRPRPL